MELCSTGRRTQPRNRVRKAKFLVSLLLAFLGVSGETYSIRVVGLLEPDNPSKSLHAKASASRCHPSPPRAPFGALH